MVNTLAETRTICSNVLISCHFPNTPAATQGDIGLLYIPSVTFVCISGISHHIIIGSRTLYVGLLNEAYAGQKAVQLTKFASLLKAELIP